MTPLEGQSLSHYIQDDVPPAPFDRGEEAPHSAAMIRSESDGFHLITEDKEGNEVRKLLTNFTAWVACELRYPENSTRNSFRLMMRDHRGRIRGPLDLPVADFHFLSRWLANLGSTAMVMPGVSDRQVIHAIQVASGEPAVRTTYDRIGPVTLPDGSMRWLAGNGALSIDGFDDSISVDAGTALADYEFQDPSDRSEDVIHAVKGVLGMIGVAQTSQGEVAMYALVAAAFRSVLITVRSVRFSVSLVGETGSGKSAVAGLVLSLFGSRFTYDHLTANWNSSPKSLLDLLTRAVSAFVVIDDYVEVSSGLIDRQSSGREMIKRQIGNGASRDVLNRDGSRKDGAEPAAMMISTQETKGSNLPASEEARQLVVALEKRGSETPDISIDRLRVLQREYGRTGLYNLAMSAYIQEFMRNIGEAAAMLETMHDQALEQLKQNTRGLALHERTLTNIAELAIGWQMFLLFASKTGAIARDQIKGEYQLGFDAFVTLAKSQAREQAIETPETVIVELLQEAFASRTASLRDRESDNVPPDPHTMGWRSQSRTGLTDLHTDYAPARHEIGWIDDSYVYLMPKKTSEALSTIAGKSRVSLPVGERDLGKTLERAGFTLSGHEGRATRKVELAGRKIRVLVIPRDIVFAESGSVDTSNLRAFPTTTEPESDQGAATYAR